METLLREDMQRNDALLESQATSIKQIELQLEQLDNDFSERRKGSLPSNTETSSQARGSRKEKITTYRTRKWRARGKMNNEAKRLPRSIAKPEGKIQDVLVQVDKFLSPTDFVILKYEADQEVPIILGWPFILSGRALINVHQWELKMHFNDEEVKFNVVNAMKFPIDDKNYTVIKSFGWVYFKEGVYEELFSTKEFFEEEDPNYILEEENAMSGERKFESLDLQIKGKKKR
ncbi:uncharacterized protein E6C27_scaffold2741G00320 [Cucumis melo var. makuwa]|uniref:Reverse transcriptase domain-containing protein n=1 Tax=Cucumis melo var. makuwa TaxID=1194695 RepID=A0A5A7TL87_CUCMM|nr:uncharacterized protein E6C27_scaffold2741G00320 [Cucumis melo var. makuwa]